MQNNKKYWLIGGLIGLVFLTIITYVSALSTMNCATIGTRANLCNNTVSVYAFWFSDVMSTIEHPASIVNQISTPFSDNVFIFILIWNTILGALLGWIYGKIRNRNRV